MRIAMWSGPRNLSTAMMYSFAARGDCAVVDEPFYAAYLARTGIVHPMREEILAAQNSDPVMVERSLLGPYEGAHFYQKHMTQHMVDGIPRDWMRDVVNVFLIRHPARVVASFAAKYEAPTLEDIGFVQQGALYDALCGIGQRPVVVDASDIRADPAGVLQRLCAAIGIEWTERMLIWPAGGHAADGVWGAHWYGAVRHSTGFAAAEGPLPVLSGAQAELAEAALPAYRALEAAKI
ncbi:HAD family hydrolase [Roseovarius sp. LXJ103]|uniref:sulfotransferase-like domain-containing protein n=1 Tax=Roseovarius carneus TaxID=2853164 RepID=UPI000D61CBE5|nr:sulfotransferase family protein [Roseovarius carneus]MBZ8117905.1 HAD family hydrolase [Roseovarius carneus]PWE36339.1 sulfotransferase family protein [Pelagicola sp. LXJ1103]